MNKFYPKKSFFYAPLTLALGLSFPAITLANDSQELDPLVVTAQRISQPLSQTLAATTLITRADIDRLQPSSLADLLQGQAGMEIGRNAGKMGITSVFMRGTNSSHTLVLLDGQKINDPTAGGTSLQFIPVSQIERVEIVRGPQSSAWGADALGGVINIITRKEHDRPYAGHLRERIGRYNTYGLDGDLRVGNEATRLNLGLSLERSDGFNAKTDDTSGEEDGYEHYNVNLGLEQDLGEQHQLGFKILHNRGENEYDGCSHSTTYASSNDCLQKFAVTSAQGRWLAELNKNWEMSLKASRTEELREDHFEGADNGEIQTRRDTINLEHRFNYNDYSAGLGADASREKLLEAEGFDETQRDTYGIYAQGNFEFLDAPILSLGIRYDDDEFFGDHATGNAALAWNFAPEYQVGTSVNTGYRAPNLQELYKPAWGGNPELEPEESINYEAWVDYNNSQGSRIRATLFQNDIDNLIVSDSSYQMQNLNKARIQGLEIDARYRLDNWRLGFALTVQDPENRETGDQLPRRAKQHGKLDLDYQSETWSLGGSLQGQDERQNSDFDSLEMPGYAIVNLRGHYAFNQNWRVDGKIDNVLDKDYELASGYNTAGIYPEVSLRFDF
ncbi:TonB-dependent receptor domain-containing protein [Marinospirillum sp.]|uniref:TonB-dependent receptor plug domain-containing protein n=1 Tax=Marinospirillum sp. TaxID=2183934 RepID=UPI00287015BB|nr:TonB-dependent receptor [Marinospirillum sp.]MDR9467286.1 TonB-dependent receptor [Marinospirillum sp.]